MKKVLVNYANDLYADSQKKCSESARKYKFDEIYEFSPKDITEDYYLAHKEILDYKRGNGLWLWKPYFIKKVLEKLDDGDVLFYMDSGAFFFRSPKPVFKILEGGDIWTTVVPLKEKQFTKKDTFALMGLTEKKYTETRQVSGTFIAIKKDEFTVKLVDEWLSYCEDIRILAPVTDNSNEMDGFIAHREDQSIFSLLLKKYDIHPYQDPTQYGRLPEKYKCSGFEMDYYDKHDYNPFIIHHRCKGALSKKVIRNQWLCAVLPRWIGLKLIDK